LAFKEGIDDCRESPAMDIVYELLNYNTKIVAYDPKAMGVAKTLLGDKIKYAKNMYAVAYGADALAVLTEWPEFKTLDLGKIAKTMRHKNIIDCRNLLDPKIAKLNNIVYKGIGR